MPELALDHPKRILHLGPHAARFVRATRPRACAFAS
jgi:hypothetical protein